MKQTENMSFQLKDTFYKEEAILDDFAGFSAVRTSPSVFTDSRYFPAFTH